MLSVNKTTTKGPGTAANSGPGYPPNASWSNPNNALADDGSSATIGFFEGGQDGDTLVLTNFGFNLPAGAIVDGVSVRVDGSNIGCYGSVLLNKSGDSGFKDASNLNTTYGGNDDLWGMTLTASEVNNTAFGISVALSDVSGGDGFASVDYAEITVYWHYDVSVPAADVPLRADYKVYGASGAYLGNLPNVISELSFPQEINSVGSSLKIQCAAPIDVIGTPPVAPGTISQWLPGDWAYRKKITIPFENLTSDLSSFPVYLDLSTLGTDFFAQVDSAGADIRITTATGITELPFDLVGISTSARTGELWFKADLLSSDNNEFYVYYGSPTASAYSASSTYGSQNVWGDYYGVYHLESNANDSSAEANNGAAVASPTYAAAKLGKGVLLNGTSQYVNLGGATSALDNDIAGDTTFTISFWLKTTSAGTISGTPSIIAVNTAALGNTLLIRVQNGSQISIYDGVSAADEITGGNAVNDAGLHHVVYKRNGSTGTLYVDGVLVSTHTINYSFAAGDLWSIGQEWDAGPTASDFWPGTVDEMRVRKSDVSTDWQLAEYTNQNTPTDFYIVGIREADTGDSEVLIKDGNIVEAWETSYYYPNGKRLFRGQIQRVQASIKSSPDNVVSMIVYSDGRDFDNTVARGAPLSYTNDQVQTSQNGRVSVIHYDYGGWEFYGQLFTVGVGITKLGRITLMLDGTATVTVSVYAGADLGPLLGSVTKSVSVGGPTAVDFILPSQIPVTAGLDYFITVTVNSNQSIWLHRSSSNPYANGAMYWSSYSGGSGGGSYAVVSGSDLYFVTAAGTPQTTATFSTQDPTTGMLAAVMDDYIERGGLISYNDDTIDPTGLSLTSKISVNTVLDVIKLAFAESPNGFYYYVDLGENLLYFKRAALTADIILTKGKEIEDIDLDFSIENVLNQLLFSGGDTGGGSNLFREYNNSLSQDRYGTRLDRKSDNRVTVTNTADVIGKSTIAKQKDEQYSNGIKVLGTVMDITQFTPGKTVGFRGFGWFIDRMVLQVVRTQRAPREVDLTVGNVPIRFGSHVEEITRGLIAEQTLNNPSAPS